MRLNIFKRKYDVAEDKLTETFIRFLSCLEKVTQKKFLNRLGVRVLSGFDLRFEMQREDGASRLDAEIIDFNRFVMFFEIKKTSPLILAQLRHYANLLNKYNFKKKSLFVIAPDYYELKEVQKEWHRCRESRFVSGFFKSWTEIFSLAKNLADKSSKKDGFLLNQFADYLKEEEVVNMERKISKEDCRVWKNYQELHTIFKSLLGQEIRVYVESLFKKLSKQWEFEAFSTLNSSEIHLSYKTNPSAKHLVFEVGFYPGKKGTVGWEEPNFYAGFYFHSKHYYRFLKNKTYIKKAKQLQKRGFIAFRQRDVPQDFYRTIKLDDLIKQRTIDYQKMALKKIIRDTISIFYAIGISKLLKKER